MKARSVAPALAERLAGWRERRPRLGPETVHIDITNVCNLDCVTCWNYAPDLATPKSTAWKRQRLAAADFLRLVDEVAATGTERIIISGGGEPFTHPAIYDFIAAVKARGLALTVISNATLCDWARLRQTPPDQMLVNVAAGSAASYAAYHPNRSPADFDALVAALRALADVIRLNLVQVINRLNYAELPAMVELAADIGARSSFKLGDAPPGTEAFALDAGQRCELLDALIPRARARAKALVSRHNLDAFAAQLAAQSQAAVRRAAGNNDPVSPFAKGGTRGILQRLSHPQRPEIPPIPPLPKGGVADATAIDAEATAAATDDPPPCFAGYLYSRIHVDGRVFFCCEHIEVGNVADADFATIWRSPAYAAVRERLHEGRGYPGCRRCGKHDMNHDAALALAALDAQESNR